MKDAIEKILKEEERAGKILQDAKEEAERIVRDAKKEKETIVKIRKKIHVGKRKCP
jgi:vacuolar-type H+-ATPase subunit H